MKSVPNSAAHYLLVKREGLSKAGARMDASESARVLLQERLWPLWEGTRNRKAMRAGDITGIYLAGAGAGNQSVVAIARISAVTPWSPKHQRRYPLMLDGTPIAALELFDVRYMDAPIPVKPRLGRLSIFANGVPSKWGVMFMGGTRALSARDFEVLFQP